MTIIDDIETPSHEGVPIKVSLSTRVGQTTWSSVGVAGVSTVYRLPLCLAPIRPEVG